MILKSSVIGSLRLKHNKNCVRALEDLHSKSFYTMQEWIKNNNPLLCTLDSLNVISAYLRLDVEDIVEEPMKENQNCEDLKR